MKPTGFSTGALAKGEFRDAVDWVSQTDCDAIELSALRKHELKPLLEGLAELDLSRFRYMSIHAPKDFEASEEPQIVDDLRDAAQKGFRVVLHPDAIHNIQLWKMLGDSLCIENMDMRNSTGRTADEMEYFFKCLPDALLCFDIGHARHVDPSMAVAYEFIKRFRNRIAHLHVSEVDTAGAHWAMTMRCLMAFEDLVSTLSASVAVIIESQVKPSGIDSELRSTREAISRSGA